MGRKGMLQIGKTQADQWYSIHKPLIMARQYIEGMRMGMMEQRHRKEMSENRIDWERKIGGVNDENNWNS